MGIEKPSPLEDIRVAYGLDCRMMGVADRALGHGLDNFSAFINECGVAITQEMWHVVERESAVWMEELKEAIEAEKRRQEEWLKHNPPPPQPPSPTRW